LQYRVSFKLIVD